MSATPESAVPLQAASPPAKTKLCRNCREPIHVAASKCPKCQAFQSHWWHIGMAAMGILPMLIVIPLLLSLSRDSYRREHETTFSQVKHLFRVTDIRLKCDTPPVEEGTTVQYFRRPAWVYGVLHNDSDERWEDIELVVQFQDAAGKSLDLENVALNKTVLPHSSLEFRVSCDLAIDSALIRKTVARVTDAAKPFR